jgi:Glycosyltransferase family 10 (fucosyltransferase) C-term
MVSIRRPAAAGLHANKAHKTTTGSSILNFRNFVIAFLLWQVINLTLLKQTVSTKESPSKPDAAKQQRVEPEIPVKPKLPPVKIDNLHEMSPDAVRAQQGKKVQSLPIVDQRNIKSDLIPAQPGLPNSEDGGMSGEDNKGGEEDGDEEKDAGGDDAGDTEKGENRKIGETDRIPEPEGVPLQDAPLSPANAKGGDAANTRVRFGTGPAQNGYVVDFFHERENEPFRKEAFVPHYREKEEEVSKIVSDTLLHCEEISATGRRLVQSPKCQDISQTGGLWVYNKAWFPRSYCGKLIEPGQAVQITEICKEPVRLFPHPEMVPITGMGMPPIQVQSQPVHHTPDAALFETIECNIGCKWEKDMRGTDYYIDGMPWKLRVTMEDPAYSIASQVERTAYRRDQYYSTTSLKSSVPLSFFTFDKYDYRKAPAIDWDTAGNKATYLLNDGCMGGNNRRHRWAEAIQALLPVASYGKCQHTTDLGAGQTIDTVEGRVALAKQNRILLAFESGSEKYHITDIAFEAFLSGAVPAYMGASNAASVLPKNSFIDGSTFNEYNKFGAFIAEVSNNKTLWESYQAWRSDEAALAEFEDRFQFTRISSQCRTCRWAFAKMYGLGWDHTHQVVTDTTLPRHLCVATETHLVTKPFYEVWKQLGANPTHEGLAELCQKEDMQQEITIEQDNYKVVREIAHHDGVTDVLIKSIENENARDDIVLRLELGVRNYEGAYFRNTHTLVETERGGLVTSASIQDRKSKVTILANWETKIYSPEEGAMEIVITKKGEALVPGENRRIRIIIEDMSSLHDKLTEFFPSAFSQRLIKDFVDPLEYFYKDK